ncbi:MAG: transposase [bacterium]
MILSLRKGNKVLYKNEIYEILNPLSLEIILGKNINTNEIAKLPINELSIPNKETVNIKTPAEAIDEKNWQEAKRRLEIINPLLTADRTRENVQKRADEFTVAPATLYRWIRKYTSTGTLSSLVPNFQQKGGKGKKRLDQSVDNIMKKVIEEEYLSKQKLPATKIFEDIKLICIQAGAISPSENTVRNRIKELDPIQVYKGRRGRSEFLNNYSPVKGSFNANFPLEIVQIDHTPLDIIIVDEIMRKPIGRTYITLAMDIFSRMIFGFYVTFQAPSFFSVGQTLYMGIMPKNNYLENLGVEGDWNIYGIPKSMTVHLDNASEFRGNALKRFCEEFNIGVDFRPRGAPYYGGHIERVVKTMNMRIHTLQGTTFSNPKEKGEYKSEAKAVFTIRELEKWIAEFIVNVYHKTIHSELGMTPEKKYETGILGDDNTAGTGLPDIIDREEAEKIRISLLPFIERTVQKDGVSFENIKYYHDVLRKYIRIEDTKSKKRKTFILRFDPRDISKIYFYEPDLKIYFPIPYRNMGNPCVSIWEIREARNYLKKEGLKNYDESKVFQALKKLKQIEVNSFEKTKSARRKLSSNNYHKDKMKLEIESQLKLQSAYKNKTENYGTGREETGTAEVPEQSKHTDSTKETVNLDEILTFDIDTYDD